MKTSMTKVSAALALMAFSGAAMAGISNTRHNLGSGLLAGNGTNDGTTEICVFCHTPHGGDTTSPIPLWNRVTTTAGDANLFQRYSALQTGTIEGLEVAVGDISIACLSCHDGTQGMDVVLNAPGFGGATTSAGINGLGGTAGWADGHRMDGTNSTGANLAGELVYIGTDLRNDHPISIQYGGGGLTTAGGTTQDADFNATASGTRPNGKFVWWIDTNNDATKQKTDLPLYTRGTGAAQEPYVECGSCHDPHVENSTFLRFATGNANSQVCLACHNK